MKYSEDSLINAIYQGIKRGIQVTFDNECLGSCLILIYCGIDSMAYLSLPAGQEEVRREDFIRWVNQYLSPGLSNGRISVTGEDLYSARCAVVHTYTSESRTTKIGLAKIISYQYGGGLPVFFDPNVEPNMIIIRIEAFRDIFFGAIDKFLVESYAVRSRQPLLEARLKKLLITVPNASLKKK